MRLQLFVPVQGGTKSHSLQMAFLYSQWFASSESILNLIYLRMTSSLKQYLVQIQRFLPIHLRAALSVELYLLSGTKNH